MSSETIAGSCLCGSVQFEIRPPFAAFRYCHCSRCQKASGSAHAANILVPEAQFQWRAGYGDAAAIHAATPFLSARPLRVILVVSQGYADSGLVRLQARFPQAAAWSQVVLPADARVIMLTAELSVQP